MNEVPTNYRAAHVDERVKWSIRRFRLATFLLVLSSFRFLYLYNFIYSILRQHYVSSIALVQWACHLSFYAWFAHTCEKRHRRCDRTKLLQWIIANVVFYSLLILVDIVIFVVFRNTCDKLEITQGEPEMIYSSATGHIPAQLIRLIRFGTIYIVWSLIESLVIRPWSIIEAIVLVKRTIHVNNFGFRLRLISFVVRTLAILIAMMVCIVLYSFVALVLPSKCSDSLDWSCYRDCSPLATRQCLLPFPSSHFQRRDDDNRLHFSEHSMPLLRYNRRLDPSLWNDFDGYSTMTPILFEFASEYDPVSLGGTLTNQTIEQYTGQDVKTLIIDAERDERHAHWVDPAHTRQDNIVTLRLAVPLRHSTRYVVGVRRFTSNAKATILGDSNEHGGRIPVPESMHILAAKRFDEHAAGARNISREQWNHYQEHIFPVFDRQGIDRRDLQLAWDFTTRSYERGAQQVQRAFDSSCESVRASPDYRIDNVDEERCDAGVGSRGRSVHVKLRVASYRANADITKFSPLLRDRHSGEYRRTPGDALTSMSEVGITIYIPCSALDTRVSSSSSSRDLYMVQYGHSVFSQRLEFMLEPLRNVSDRQGWIVFGMEWPGVSQFDALRLAGLMLNHIEYYNFVPESVTQGLINQGAAAELMLHDGFRHEPVFGSVLQRARFAGYWGNSLGAIVGGAYFALSHRIDRAALISGGSPYMMVAEDGHMYNEIFVPIMLANFHSSRDMRATFGLMQLNWDTAEIGGWLSSMYYARSDSRDRRKRALIQGTLDDSTVSEYATHIMARSLHARQTWPRTHAVYDIDDVHSNDNHTNEYSVYTEFGYLPETIEISVHLHTALRFHHGALDQLAVFLEQGKVIHPCDGACIDQSNEYK